jgi:hypothetical protein
MNEAVAKTVGKTIKVIRGSMAQPHVAHPNVAELTHSTEFGAASLPILSSS